MAAKRTIKAEILRGPFDPGGQPVSATGQPVELSFFAWNVRFRFVGYQGGAGR